MVIANPLILKLRHGASLTEQDQQVLERITSRTHHIDARQDVIREGSMPDDVHLVMRGVACRYKIVQGGGRTIMALLLAGDFCDLHVAILGEMDHGIAALTPCTLVEIPRRTIEELTEHHPRIARALWWATLVDEGVLREWLVGMGQRDAEHRMAHLFCELLVRLQTVGLADKNSFELPITQQVLGEVLALSAVHVNRTLRTLRGEGLLDTKDRRWIIPDVDRLEAFAEFTPNYLHLTGQVGTPADH